MREQLRLGIWRCHLNRRCPALDRCVSEAEHLGSVGPESARFHSQGLAEARHNRAHRAVWAGKLSSASSGLHSAQRDLDGRRGPVVAAALPGKSINQPDEATSLTMASLNLWVLYKSLS